MTIELTFSKKAIITNLLCCFIKGGFTSLERDDVFHSLFLTLIYSLDPFYTNHFTPFIYLHIWSFHFSLFVINCNSQLITYCCINFIKKMFNVLCDEMRLNSLDNLKETKLYNFLCTYIVLCLCWIPFISL